MGSSVELNLVLLGAEQSGKSTLLDCVFKAAESTTADSKNAAQKHPSIVGHLRNVLAKGKEDDDESIIVKTSQCCFNIVDVSGHKLFLQDLLSGGAKADVALLVIDAVHGNFERQISNSGLTRDHVTMASDLGIKKLVVAVSKMDDDSVRFSEQRFQEISAETRRHLEHIGYTAQRVPFVPVSGSKGHNVAGPKEDMSWYTGQTLLQILDDVGMAPVTSLSRRPLRMPIEQVHSIGDVGTVVTGCVETGTLHLGQQIGIAPGDLIAKVDSIEVGGQVVEQVEPGSVATFSLGNQLGAKSIRSGMVVSHSDDDAARDCVSFTARISVFSHPDPLRPGMQLTVNCHVADVPCVLEEFIARMDPKTGKILEAHPKQLNLEDAALVRLQPLEPVCVEAFNEYRGLGQFALRGGGVTLAVGIIKEVLKRRPPPVTVAAE
jgi:elongation factor 1-alpha